MNMLYMTGCRYPYIFFFRCPLSAKMFTGRDMEVMVPNRNRSKETWPSLALQDAHGQILIETSRKIWEIYCIYIIYIYVRIWKIEVENV